MLAVVVASNDRRELLPETLPGHLALPERPEVVLVDDAPADGTAEAVRAALPEVRVIALGARGGAAARNAGLEATAADVVALADDCPAPSPAASCCAARRCSGPAASRSASASAGRRSCSPSSCAPPAGTCATTRRSWPPNHPPGDARPERRAHEVRNARWTAWPRRSPSGALRRTASIGAGARDPHGARGVAGLPGVLRDRRQNPPEVERLARLLDRTARRGVRTRAPVAHALRGAPRRRGRLAHAREFPRRAQWSGLRGR